MNLRISPKPMRRPTRGPSWRLVLWRTLRIILVTYLVVVLLAMLFEESLIFFPSRHPQGDWSGAGLPIEDAELAAADGTRLHGWYIPHPQPTAQILFLHGNAGNITDRIDALQRLYHDVEASVLILDYRGYGRSEGQASEQGVLQDARAARAWLAERAGVEESEIVLLGESLGGGVAIALAAETCPRALVLQNTFTSIPDIAAVHYPFLPVRLLMSTQLNSLSKIKNCDAPLLQCHGTTDMVVPFEFGRRLFDASAAKDKVFLEHPCGHNDLLPAGYYTRLREFLAQHPAR